MDAFIVRNIHPINKSGSIVLNFKKSKYSKNDFEQINGQSLLPKTFIWYDRYNNRCDLNEWRCLPIQNQCRYSCLNCKQFILGQDHNDFSCDPLKTLVKLVDKRLTKKQKLILKKISTNETKTTMTSLSNILSEELNISKTTARVILQFLRDVGLITCGKATNKGEPVRLTEIGKIIIDSLKENENWEMKK